LFGVNLRGFTNYYGYTSSIYDVNEGNEIVGDIFKDDATEHLIRKRFVKLTRVMKATSQRPLIFKNVAAYLHIHRLQEAIPEIFFLRIKRNPEQIIQSVMRAYHELGYFNPIPLTLSKEQINDPVEFGVRQILEIERIIDFQKEKVGGANWLEWQYEDFCSNPWPMLEHLLENYLKMPPTCLRHDVLAEPLKVSNRVKVSATEATRISLILQQYIDNVGQYN
jgi:hypothetical protein